MILIICLEAALCGFLIYITILDRHVSKINLTYLDKKETEIILLREKIDMLETKYEKLGCSLHIKGDKI